MRFHAGEEFAILEAHMVVQQRTQALQAGFVVRAVHQFAQNAVFVTQALRKRALVQSNQFLLQPAFFLIEMTFEGGAFFIDARTQGGDLTAAAQLHRKAQRAVVFARQFNESVVSQHGKEASPVSGKTRIVPLLAVVFARLP